MNRKINFQEDDQGIVRLIYKFGSESNYKSPSEEEFIFEGTEEEIEGIVLTNIPNGDTEIVEDDNLHHVFQDAPLTTELSDEELSAGQVD